MLVADPWAGVVSVVAVVIVVVVAAEPADEAHVARSSFDELGERQHVEAHQSSGESEQRFVVVDFAAVVVVAALAMEHTAEGKQIVASCCFAAVDDTD